MSEPVSAYGVFKAAKSHKKSKKSNGTTGGAVKRNILNSNNKGASKASSKLNILNTSGAGKTKANQSKPKDLVKSKAKQQPAKKTTTTETSKKSDNKDKHGNIKDSEVINLVEKLYSDPQKKLDKADQKNKNDLEDYLVKELEKDDIEKESVEEIDIFDSEGSDEDSFSDSDEFSDEYTINGSSSFSDEETVEEETSTTQDDSASYSDEEESSSTNGEDNQAAEVIISKANKKRKSLEPSTSKDKINSTNGKPEAKKSKNSEETKSTSRKSLPAEKSKPVEEHKPRRSSLASVEDFSKKSTSKSPARKMSTTVKLEPLSPPSNIVKLNSIEEGKRAFKWLLNPVAVSDFFSKYWEKKACLIKRQQSNYFSNFISFEGIDQMLLKNHVEFTKNIDVTSYKNGIRETLNPEGRAMPPVVWDHYGQGCSIRLLNPQTFLPGLYTLSATMQEYFQCLVGANAYLTPPNSQGFAPHYDDIEAFVLQIEGRKRWKLYKPRKTSEILPRFSSGNFTQKEIGKPVLEEVLEPGDVLYFPRGTIHQACTEPGYHSLHITLSVYQKQSYADLFEKMVPLMLQKAITSNVDLRRGLPLHAWQNAGIAFSDNSTEERANLTKTVTKLMQKCIRDMPLEEIMDSAIDQLAKKFQHEALPPEVLPSEKLRTVFGSRSRTNERGECVCDYDIDERTNVRLLRANILRLVDEEEKIRIYYYLDNSKEYCQYEPNFIEIEATEAASVEVLIKSYPEYIGVSQLPLSSDDQKITLVTALWERGLLMMEKPFK